MKVDKKLTQQDEPIEKPIQIPIIAPLVQKRTRNLSKL